MDRQFDACMYSAQGILICKRSKGLVKEGFIGQNCIGSAMMRECLNDEDCGDSTMSCRIIPASRNATTKVCMPDDLQYATKTLMPY